MKWVNRETEIISKCRKITFFSVNLFLSVSSNSIRKKICLRNTPGNGWCHTALILRRATIKMAISHLSFRYTSRSAIAIYCCCFQTGFSNNVLMCMCAYEYHTFDFFNDKNQHSIFVYAKRHKIKIKKEKSRSVIVGPWCFGLILSDKNS